MSKLPPATFRSLKALDAAPNKKLYLNTSFRPATGVKSRAFWPLVRRLENAHLISIGRTNEGQDASVEITYGGIKALADHRSAS